MGNILGLKRYGQTSSTGYDVIDDLSLSYVGNRLKKVADRSGTSAFNNSFEFKDGIDLSTEYEYDENGNLTKDLNKKKTAIQYNCLNLPSRVMFANGNSISYLYDAAGRKLRTVHVLEGDSVTTDYCGNVVYENGVPQILLTEVGYVSLTDGKYHYYLKDHQGNNRVVVDEEGTVEEVNDYYAFGGLMSTSSRQSVQPYKYNGKELDRKGGLDWYDYGARYYDAALGRWHVVDPMAEEYYSLSPYVYCNNNPICNRDEEGKFINNIIGAVIGGAADLGVQVAANLLSDKGVFDNIDWVSVGASAVEGGLTSGLSAGKTLVVKTGVAIAKNTINGIKDGGCVSDIVNNTVKDIVTDKVIGKTSDIVGKGAKKLAPGVENQLNQSGNKMVLSNNKATKITEKIPGVSDVKTARKIATSKNGLVDASKTVNRAIQNIPENVTDISVKIYKKKNEQE